MSPPRQMIRLLEPSGHSITELSSSGGWNRGEVYAGGKHLATYSAALAARLTSSTQIG